MIDNSQKNNNPNYTQDLITSQNNNKPESELFSRHHPFIEIIVMSVGPFLTQFGFSFLDSVDLMLISRRFKNSPDSFAVQIIGIGFFVQQIVVYIGMYLQQAIMVRVTTLIGRGNRVDARQLTVDIYRISILSSF